MHLPPKRTVAAILAQIVAANLALLSTRVCAQTDWTPVSSGTTSSLSGVGFGAGKFVAVGDSGTILTSTDGENWMAQTSGTPLALRTVTYGGGKWLAVGQNGTALTSPDGVTWTPQDARTTRFLSGAAYGNGIFVAVGGSGTRRYSTDGIAWLLGTGSFPVFLQSVAFGGGLFVAVGADGTVLRSADGQTWHASTSGLTTYLSSVTYHEGKFYATGQGGSVISSADGVVWGPETSGTTEWLLGITAGDAGLVAAGFGGTIVQSADGASWGDGMSGVSTDIFGLGAGGGLYIAVGDLAGVPMQGLILKSGSLSNTGLTFEQWRMIEFEMAELDDLNVSGADADPDWDGLTNFLEYTLGLPPKVSQPDDGTLPTPSIVNEGNGMRYLAITFKRPSNRVGIVTYLARGSGDPIQWGSLGASEEILGEDGNGIQTVRIKDTQPLTLGDPRFMRLFVTDGDGS